MQFLFPKLTCVPSTIAPVHGCLCALTDRNSIRSFLTTFQKLEFFCSKPWVYRIFGRGDYELKREDRVHISRSEHLKSRINCSTLGWLGQILFKDNLAFQTHPSRLQWRWNTCKCVHSLIIATKPGRSKERDFSKYWPQGP